MGPAEEVSHTGAPTCLLLLGSGAYRIFLISGTQSLCHHGAVCVTAFRHAGKHSLSSHTLHFLQQKPGLINLNRMFSSIAILVSLVQTHPVTEAGWDIPSQRCLQSQGMHRVQKHLSTPIMSLLQSSLTTSRTGETAKQLHDTNSHAF